jgi:hypothetical protein
MNEPGGRRRARLERYSTWSAEALVACNDAIAPQRVIDADL